MALTDLTGTTWVWNETIKSPFTSYNESAELVNFTSNNQQFLGMSFLYSSSGHNLRYSNGSGVIDVYNFNTNTWSNPSYRIIEIDEQVYDDPWLSSYLKANATKIIPSFTDVEVTPHEGYITMSINGVDFNLKTAASVSLISFSISSNVTATYQAEDGMTWAEWVASDYNTGGFVVVTGRIFLAGSPVAYGSGTYVSSSDTIQSGYDYVLGGGGAN